MTAYRFLDPDQKIVAGDDGSFSPLGSPAYQRLRYGGGDYDPVQIADYEAPPAAPILAVTARQARHALLNVGLLDAVETMVNQAGNEALKIDWDFADTIRRDSPILIAAAQAFGMGDAELDNLMQQAAAIPE